MFFRVQVFQNPGFSGFRFFRVHVFQGLGFSESRFFRVRIFQGPGFSVSRLFKVQVLQGPGFSGSGSRARVQVLEVSSDTSRKLLRNRNETFPIVRYFTQKIELVSNILWVIVEMIIINQMSFFVFILPIPSRFWEAAVHGFSGISIKLLEKNSGMESIFINVAKRRIENSVKQLRWSFLQN